ncbi:unnamed protein product [Coffea canephora]|uniref:Protein kinase domain-containing protein n=1 Tax=Coffea canephora TaxID=49390 RepID=A0A068URF1_COFCA|nr:unnamed protein product [Coffea canephora]
MLAMRLEAHICCYNYPRSSNPFNVIQKQGGKQKKENYSQGGALTGFYSIETKEIVAIKKVFPDKSYKELQIVQMLDHPNVVPLKHFFFSTTDKEELYLNLVLEFVIENVNCITKQYNRMNQRMTFCDILL